MDHRISKPVVVLLLVTLAALSGPSAVRSSDSSFFESVDVEVVNVEVFVTDRRGEPVSGLTAEDFEITQGGESMEITNFYAASAALGIDEASAVPRLSTAERRIQTDVRPVDQRLNLVIFLDNRNIDPKNRNRVIKALRGSLLSGLNPEDRVTIVAYDGSLAVRQGLTGDPERLVEVLDDMADRGATGVFSRMDRIAILRDLQLTDLEAEAGGLSRPSVGFSGVAGADEGDILQQIRSYTRGEYLRIASTVQAMAQFVDTLAGLDGRKALVYVSDGLSLRPGEALYQAYARKAGAFSGFEAEAREYDATQLIEQLAKVANSSRVTFYSVLAAGASSRGPTLAERTALVDVGASGFGSVWDEGLDELERANFRSSMQILAAATGGLATASTRNFGKALLRIQKDLGTFYSLGYAAPEGGQEGEDFRVKVRVKRDGLEVRHRETFRIRSQDQVMQARTRSALLFEDPKNPLGVRVEFGPPQEEDDDVYRVPILVKFPLSQIVLVPGEGTHDGKVSIYVGAREVEGGGLSPVQKLPAPIRIPEDRLEQALGQVAGYRMMLQLRPGEHTVAVSVRDDVAQVESTSVVEFDAGEAAQKLASTR
ncbi:MAG: VWA domain-containing protein [Acidobacteriota bacterium]